MSDQTLTRERILAVAEEVLRRFGPAKMTVIDVARALGVSHGSIYRHFPSKAALHDAVTAHWLAEKSAPLTAIAHEHGPATDRLRRWLDSISSTKNIYAHSDPELFATYRELAAGARGVVRTHIATLIEQIAQIIRDGVAQGEFVTADPLITARAVFIATARFHDPTYAAEWADPDITASLDSVWSLILSGLAPRTPSQSP